jgi:hypothetical protein
MAGDANVTCGEWRRPRRGLLAQFATELLVTFLAISLGLLAGIVIDHQMEKSSLAKTVYQPVAPKTKVAIPGQNFAGHFLEP